MLVYNKPVNLLPTPIQSRICIVNRSTGRVALRGEQNRSSRKSATYTIPVAVLQTYEMSDICNNDATADNMVITSLI